MSPRRLVTALVLAVSLVGVGAAPTEARTNGLPDSMAAIGDSITTAANTSFFDLGGSNPERSWSTGDDSGDIVLSHYERLLAANPTIAGRNLNDAAPGAKMRDAAGQAQRAVSQGVEYVTFLMGGNDVCTSSKHTMTSVRDFRQQFRAAMDALATGLPEADVLVASIPDVHHLWELYHTDPLAQWVWGTFGICQSMLSASNTDADRAFVQRRNIAFNAVLRDVCAEYVRCRYDGGAVFDYQFTRSDISPVDFFHPSTVGQMHIAEVTWAAGYWPAT
jgi:lysophospholipase L1-like esterase